MEASSVCVLDAVGLVHRKCPVVASQRTITLVGSQVVRSRLRCFKVVAERRGTGTSDRFSGLSGRPWTGSRNSKSVLKEARGARSDKKSGTVGQETEDYRLREGEWVTEVADRLGVPLRDIQTLNPTINMDKVIASQVIKVPRSSKWLQKEGSNESLPDSKPSVHILESPNLRDPGGESDFEVDSSSGVPSPAEVIPPLSEARASESSPSGDMDENGHNVGNQQSSTFTFQPETANGDGSRDQRRGELEYMVQPGDYLADIASRHGVKLKSLIALNKLNYEERIRVGQILLIPPEETADLEVHGSSEQSAWLLFRGLASDPFFQSAAFFSAIFVASAIILLKMRQPFKGRVTRSLAPSDAPSVESSNRIQERPSSFALELPFGRSRYLRQLKAAASSIATNMQATFDRPELMKVGEGFATGMSQQEAIEAAYSAASSLLKGTPPVVALLSLGSGKKIKTPASQRAKEAASLLTGLASGENFRVSGVMTLGGGGFLSLADLQGKEGSLGNWAALLLFAAPENTILVSSAEPGVLGVRGAVQAAGKALVSKVAGNSKLKAIVTHVAGNIAQPVLSELSAIFPSVSCYEVSPAGNKLPGTSDWQLHEGFSLSASPGSLSQGIMLFGVTTNSDFGGAFFATVMGQWLYGKHAFVAANPPNPRAS